MATLRKDLVLSAQGEAGEVFARRIERKLKSLEQKEMSRGVGGEMGEGKKILVS